MAKIRFFNTSEEKWQEMYLNERGYMDYVQLIDRLNRLEDIFMGRDPDIETKWHSIEGGEKPADDENCFVCSWLDGSYTFPFIAYWDEDNQSFFALNAGPNFPLKVDIWCKMPWRPGVKI